MARAQSIPIRDELTSLISPRRLNQLARQTGALRRQRKVRISILFWSVILGFGTGARRTFADLRRMYNTFSGQSLVPSAFWSRFSPQLALFFKRVAEEILPKVCEPYRALRGTMAGFRDVLATDSTVIRLHDLLADHYPGSRTNHSKAAAKFHVIMSVLGHGPRTVKLTPGRDNDGRKLVIGSWIKDRLLLFDLGYYNFELFQNIGRRGGYFISRLKTKASCKILAANIKHRGRAIEVVGRSLAEILPCLERQVLDVQVQISFRRRSRSGGRRTVILRLVGVLDEESNEYHLYLTNLPPERLSAVEVANTYRARWYIEIVFLELKSSYRLEELPSQSPAAIEALLYAAIITMLASRRLLAAVRKKLADQAHRAGDLRWAKVFRALAAQILQVMTLPREQCSLLTAALGQTMLLEAVDPHLNRPLLFAQVEQGIAPW